MTTLMLVLILPMLYLNVLSEPTFPIILSIIGGVWLEIVWTKSYVIGTYKLGPMLTGESDICSLYQIQGAHTDEGVARLLANKDDGSLNIARGAVILLIHTYLFLRTVLRTGDVAPIDIRRPLSMYILIFVARWLKDTGTMQKMAANAIRIANSLEGSKHAISKNAIYILECVRDDLTISL